MNHYRLKACGKCGGDLARDEEDWICLQCGAYSYIGLYRQAGLRLAMPANVPVDISLPADSVSTVRPEESTERAVKSVYFRPALTPAVITGSGSGSPVGALGGSQPSELSEPAEPAELPVSLVALESLGRSALSIYREAVR